jgi:putative DNA primase/helicase
MKPQPMKTKKKRDRRSTNRPTKKRHEKSHDSEAIALRCAQAGLRVVPLYATKEGRCTCGNTDCDHLGRHPRTKNGLRDATSDPTAVAKMWANWPHAKIGIALGGISKVLALVAAGDAGRQTLRGLTENYGGLPKTVTILDHDRRIHLFKCHQTQIPPRKIGDGVRTLGDRKLVIAPSSFSDSTAKRRFAKKRALGQVEIARAPAWLLEVGTKLAHAFTPP